MPLDRIEQATTQALAIPFQPWSFVRLSYPKRRSFLPIPTLDIKGLAGIQNTVATEA